MIPARTDAAVTPFAGLGPELVLAAVESVGLLPDGRLMALNSYENRVYRLGIEPLPDADAPPHVMTDAVVIKFYRPGRWNDAQIREEHSFAAELVTAELQVAAPWCKDGESLHRIEGFRYSVFQCWRGSAPELDAPEHRVMLGRSLGRLHAVGRRQPFQTRGRVADWECGARARRELLRMDIIPDNLAGNYAAVSARLVAAATSAWEAAGPMRTLRLHGDCHLGNVLWNTHGPVFVDLDDCLTGPAVQDLWMMCSGTEAQRQREWTQLLEGYEQFAQFDHSELLLVEPLRAMRMLNHAAWLAARWSDPAFPKAFPWFADARYWERHITELQEQVEAVEDPPLLRIAGG
jgi:Ser/Thr protein kinase RdoA (MazF antagonist)